MRSAVAVISFCISSRPAPYSPDDSGFLSCDGSVVRYRHYSEVSYVKRVASRREARVDWTLDSFRADLRRGAVSLSLVDDEVGNVTGLHVHPYDPCARGSPHFSRLRRHIS